MAKPNLRPDHNGTQRAAFESAKKKIFAAQTMPVVEEQIKVINHRIEDIERSGQHEK